MISVIIPVVNEEAALEPLLRQLELESTPHEVIVVDGGSTDRTVELARSSGAIVISSACGRGNQICRGVEQACGDVLFFLHADSVFPAGGLQRIREALAEYPRAVGGNFRLIFDGDSGFSRWLTGFYAFIRLFRLYYGDSGIFVRRSVYDAIGGMKPIPVMEDIEFVRRLERSGRTCRIIDKPLVTSSRRFDGRWPPEIVYGWLKLHVLFWLGLSPETLACMYRKQQSKKSPGPM
ncbi:MAG TPA: TIGR04283 family arsenosugar biosynthesis glycosyltransferase [Micropepsaceae bacterium]|nr:TIGR04283 family arsenosugar biosynthesis glycosyltransferase [Micropepsaceae bacterium]